MFDAISYIFIITFSIAFITSAGWSIANYFKNKNGYLERYKMNYRKQMKYKQSEIELWELIKKLDSLNPIKIVYNKKELYNDYDSKKVIEVLEDEGKVYGERHPPEIVLAKDYSHLMNKKVYSVKIDIVEYHHSIVYITGEK